MLAARRHANQELKYPVVVVSPGGDFAERISRRAEKDKPHFTSYELDGEASTNYGSPVCNVSLTLTGGRPTMLPSATCLGCNPLD